MKYTVCVDDNFHYMDEEERYSLGEFETLEAAIDACKNNVDDFLLEHYKPRMSADDLCSGYKMFGEDPFIVGAETPVPFSAWGYAEKRSTEICNTLNRATEVANKRCAELRKESQWLTRLNGNI